MNNKITLALSVLTLASVASAQTIVSSPTIGNIQLTSATTATQTVTWAPAGLGGTYTTSINHVLDTTGASGSYSLSLASTVRLGISGTGVNGDNVSIITSWAPSHVSSSGPAAGWAWDAFPAGNVTQFNTLAGSVHADNAVLGSFTIDATPNTADFQINGTGTITSSDYIQVPGKKTFAWSATAVPEPSSTLLMGLAGSFCLIRRKR